MKKEMNFDVHKSLKARKKWGRLMKLSFLVFIAILAVCSVMLYFGFNHQWDPETEPQPVITPSTWWQWTLLIVGSLLTISTLAGYTAFVVLKSKKFYASQEVYWKTKEYAKQKEKALKIDLHTLSKKDLKLYKQMGYITAAEMRKIKDEKQNSKSKTSKKS